MAEYGRKGEVEPKKSSTWNVLMWVYMIFLWLGGLGCVAVGLWMNADPYVRSYFTVLRRSVTDNTLVSAAILLLTCGFLIVLLGILGCCGLIKKSRPFMAGFIAIMMIIMIMELTVGFLAVVFKHDIHRSVKTGMKDSLQKEYMFDNSMGKAWNFVQVREKCCGADEAHDYMESKWQASTEPDDNGVVNYAPITCCVLIPDQDRDPSRVNPQDPRIKNKRRCMEAAQARRGDEYLHKRGCFATLLDFIEMHFNTLIGLGLAIGSFQAIGLCLACIWYRVNDDNGL